jgi:hypothetical protein
LRAGLASLEKARHKRLMSGHGHHDAGAADTSYADDHEHETSSDDFPADEPRSPGWLPLLGGALFLAGIFAFVVMGSSSGKTAEELAKDAAAANPSAAPAAPGTAAPAAAAPAQRPAMAMPAGGALPANHPQFRQAPGN